MARTGRPRNFDRDEAISKAMMLFWEHGFESTSLAQLRVVMGDISAASFYAAFDSKESLFREVVDRYISTFGQATASLIDSSLTPREAIEKALRRSAKMQTEETHPLGCFLVLSASTCSFENVHICEMLAKERELTRSRLFDCIQRAVSNGELPASTDITMLTAVFETFLLGISTQSRDGISFATIDGAVTQVMGIWDTLAHSA
ncbi:TetR/AcrR family transcriptional regulator [Paenibacillus sp. N3/727]|uniref:TetR/AcrR family transcriptional regulator n=1 Tax=Paenibacillus sp. N3/727 TaxID=2925845 RepID=UPI001F53B96B|nr:TetR/AcrR family transcriptional regulator [Paenibacillus sp. N3/727]UNK16314.1 TetR/AcrR family transcriptional regulator [Paenibacillus sp. N3/727]